MSDKYKYTVALAGNPNCGKTTLFNGLTGSKQRIGNWPGVTVEKKEGNFEFNNKNINIIDLPGIYALSAYSEDEKVARDYLLSKEANLIINIVDATNIERNLYLTTQLIEMKIPMIIILNMMDIAEKQDVIIDINELSRDLGIKVIPVSAVDKKDIEKVREIITQDAGQESIPFSEVVFPNEMEDLITGWLEKLSPISRELNIDKRWLAIKILENDEMVCQKVFDNGIFKKEDLKDQIHKVEKILGDPPEIIVADHRYGFIHGLMKHTVKRRKRNIDSTDRIDKIVLNKFIGVPIFLAVMFLVFWLTINIGGAFIDFFDILFGSIFVEGFEKLLVTFGSPQWLNNLLAGGIGSGIQTVSTFIPIIFIMFFVLSFLEDSGYMARAAFLMDKFMRYIGLPGKSFVPLIVGFGCTVPAIMATRTLENKKDRYITIFMTPLMSCGARLPVYALFAAAFFQKNSGLIVFIIYLTGIVFAVLTGYILKKTLFVGETSHFIMELPPYHFPRIKHIMLHTWGRLKIFIIKAGKMIIIAVAILGFLNSMNIDGSFGGGEPDKTVLARIGTAITPVLSPMGVQKENWPASVAVITGLFAKESIVGTLNALYNQIDASDNTEQTESDGPDLILSLKEAFVSIPINLKDVILKIADPFGFGLLKEKDTGKLASEIGADEKIFTLMRSYFLGSKSRAFAYMLFVLLYFPCIAAFGAIIREIGIKMGALLVTYLTILAWSISTLFYQIASGHQMVWIIVPLILLLMTYFTFFIIGRKFRSNIGV